MRCFSNLLPKSNNEYFDKIYLLDEDVCKEYVDIAKYSAAKIEELEKNDTSGERIDFYLPEDVFANTIFKSVQIYFYREYSLCTSNYMVFEDDGEVSLSIDLHRLNKWDDYCDLEEYIVDELMNVERDYDWYKSGELEENLEYMKSIKDSLRE